MPEIFSSIISPLSSEDFRNNYSSKKGLFIAGTPDKFKQIFDWQALNSVLDTSFMVKENVLLSSPTFNSFFDLNKKSDFIYLCSQGATMQLSEMERYSLELNKLSAKLSNELQAYVRITVFASYPEKPAYNTHYDAYDAFVLQIDGEKRWKVFEPEQIKGESNRPSDLRIEKFTPGQWNRRTHNQKEIREFRPGEGSSYKEIRKYRYTESEVYDPNNELSEYREEGSDISREVQPTERKELSAPYIDKVLKPGDFLYIPAGHWHNVSPCSTPTLHLTITATYTRGMDFFSWLRDKLLKSRDFHELLPLINKKNKEGSLSGLRNYTETLNNKITGILDNKNLLSDYKNFLLIDREQPERFNFPYHFKKDAISDADEKLFKKNIEQYHIEPESINKIKVTVNGRELIIDENLEPFLRFIFNARSFTIRDLFVNLKYDSFRQVLGVLNNLVINNIIKIED